MDDFITAINRLVGVVEFLQWLLAVIQENGELRAKNDELSERLAAYEPAPKKRGSLWGEN